MSDIKVGDVYYSEDLNNHLFVVTGIGRKYIYLSSNGCLEGEYIEESGYLVRKNKQGERVYTRQSLVEKRRFEVVKNRFLESIGNAKTIEELKEVVVKTEPEKCQGDIAVEYCGRGVFYYINLAKVRRSVTKQSYDTLLKHGYSNNARYCLACRLF